VDALTSMIRFFVLKLRPQDAGCGASKRVVRFDFALCPALLCFLLACRSFFLNLPLGGSTEALTDDHAGKPTRKPHACRDKRNQPVLCF
jgi:hypothetical protein